MPLASSTVMTPSAPTFSIASAMWSPIVWSPLAEIVPTLPISFGSFVSFAIARSSAMRASTPASMPRLSDIGLWPAETNFTPSRKIASERTVAVVVPSPATSLVLLAASRTIWAPRFSNFSGRSISLATETPSLVTLGPPNDFSSMTLRPFGPSVTLTDFASVITPLSMRRRASSLKMISLAAMAVPRVQQEQGAALRPR